MHSIVNVLSMTTLRPLGPSVTFTARARRPDAAEDAAAHLFLVFEALKKDASADGFDFHLGHG
jgi:hypothetical protein